MLPSTNAFDSALNLQQSEGYNGSLARPTTGVGDATPSQDSEELELQNHSRRASSVSGFEYPCSSTQTSHTPPSPPRSEPDFVFEAAPTTAPHPRDFSLPSARAMTENPAQDGNESLRRSLHDYHIFLIAISAVIGIGYYVRTGILLRTGGEAAVVYTYSFLGILALMVMKGLTTMLKIWPIGGALIVFVEEFVDKDVAKSVAFLYWLTYCLSCASLVTSIGTLVDHWRPGTATSVGVSVLFVFLPILANLTDIRVFRNIELLAGSLKLVIALMIIIMMNVINTTIGDYPSSTSASFVVTRDMVFHHNEPVAGGWFASLMSSIFLGSFSFVGIEVVAATAQEAIFRNNDGRSIAADNADVIPADTIPPDFRPPQRDESPQMLDTAAKNPFEHAHWVPIVSTFIYLWGGWIVSHNVSWDDAELPSLPWSLQSGKSSQSIFVTSAHKKSEKMATGVNVLLFLNVVSTSSTALYVASRTLFGFAYTYTKTHDAESSRTLQFMSWLSVKSKFDVPYRAVAVSSWLLWLPFLKYLPSSHMYLNVIDVLTEMSSVSCILVWAFESLAAFSFYGCLKQSPNHGLYERIKLAARVEDKVWYLSHRIMAAVSAAFCFGVVIVGGVMTSISNPNPFQYCAAFLPLGIFIILTWVWKAGLAGRSISYRYPRLRYGAKLDSAHAEVIFQRLNNHLKHNSQGTLPGNHPKYRDLFGIIDFDWFRTKTTVLADFLLLKRSRSSDGY